MTNDFESDGASTPRKRDKVAGRRKWALEKAQAEGLAKVGAWRFC